MTTSPDSVTYPSQEYGVLGPLPAYVINVQDVPGVDPTGNNDSTVGLQSAATTLTQVGGGLLMIPPGTYRISSTILISSNTTVQGSGDVSKIIASHYSEWTIYGNAQYAMFENINRAYTDGSIIDRNITVEHLCFDYSEFGAVPGGGAHAVRMKYAGNCRVQFCRGIDGENLVAYVGCDDVLTFGCHATGQINCPYDHWAGTTNARVIGNYCDVAEAVQVVNFNSTGDGVLTQVTSSLIVSGNQFVSRRTSNPSTISLSPLATTAATRRIVITGNDCTNVRVSGQGNVTDVVVDSNFFRDNVNNTSAIQAYGDGVNTPARWKISNNLITGMTTDAPSLGVIDYRGTEGSVCDNTIRGAANIGIRFVNIGVASGNDISGPTIPISGPYVAQTDDVLVANNRSLGWRTTTDHVARLKMQVDDNLVFQGTTSLGAARNIWTVQMDSDTSQMLFAAQTRNLALHFPLHTGGLTATGAATGTALLLAAQSNQVSTVAAGTGVRLMSVAASGLTIQIVNDGANALNVYPTTGTQIDGLGVNIPFSLAAGSAGIWTFVASGQWRTISVYP